MFQTRLQWRRYGVEQYDTSMTLFYVSPIILNKIKDYEDYGEMCLRRDIILGGETVNERCVRGFFPIGID